MSLKKGICSITAAIALILSGQVDNDLRVSYRALEIIGNAEGCRLHPYKCPAGLLTNGMGNTHNVSRAPITLEQATKDWVRNIKSAENCLFSSAPNDDLTQGNIDGFTSFIFNTGCRRFRYNRDGSKTRIYKKIQAGQYTAACYELTYWVWAAGVKLPGLVIRREDEKGLCLADY
jgi:lysozyme